jgi:hypothetical protein
MNFVILLISVSLAGTRSLFLLSSGFLVSLGLLLPLAFSYIYYTYTEVANKQADFFQHTVLGLL